MVERYRPQPNINIASAMSHAGMFLPWFRGESWSNWKVVLKAIAGLSLSSPETEFFNSIAERSPPTRPVREAWLIAGRGAGKDSVASEIAAYMACTFKPTHLRRGERAVVLCLACDRDQAGIVLGYVRSYFADILPLKDMVVRETADGLELNNQCDITVATNSFRSVRGRGILCAILDEVAFYRDDRSANPDLALYAALKPGLARIPGSLMIGISTPHRRAGLLYQKFSKHYGQNSDDVLVIRAPSTGLNPTLDQSIIDKALEEDPSLAAAEWLAQWRTDIQSFVSREAVLACVANRQELPPMRGIKYTCFVDPAGGSGGGDSMTIAITHRNADDIRILDAVRERRPPFSPTSVVAEFAQLAKSYNITKIVGDHWGGEFLREPFRTHGLTYEVADRPKSSFYQDALPLINSGTCELYDHQRLIAQICGLERSTARSGKDSIDHMKGAHDDLANVVCAALVLAGTARQPMIIGPEVLAWASQKGNYVPGRQINFPNNNNYGRLKPGEI